MKYQVKFRILEPGVSTGEKEERTIELTADEELGLTGEILGVADPSSAKKIFCLLIVRNMSIQLRVGGDAFSLLLNAANGEEFILHRIKIQSGIWMRGFGGEEILLKEGDQVTVVDRVVEFTSVPSRPIETAQGVVDAYASRKPSQIDPKESRRIKREKRIASLSAEKEGRKDILPKVGFFKKIIESVGAYRNRVKETIDLAKTSRIGKDDDDFENFAPDPNRKIRGHRNPSHAKQLLQERAKNLLWSLTGRSRIRRDANGNDLDLRGDLGLDDDVDGPSPESRFKLDPALVRKMVGAAIAFAAIYVVSTLISKITWNESPRAPASHPTPTPSPSPNPTPVPGPGVAVWVPTPSPSPMPTPAPQPTPRPTSVPRPTPVPQAAVILPIQEIRSIIRSAAIVSPFPVKRAPAAIFRSTRKLNRGGAKKKARVSR